MRIVARNCRGNAFSLVPKSQSFYEAPSRSKSNLISVSTATLNAFRSNGPSTKTRSLLSDDAHSGTLNGILTHSSNTFTVRVVLEGSRTISLEKVSLPTSAMLGFRQQRHFPGKEFMQFLKRRTHMRRASRIRFQAIHQFTFTSRNALPR
ncbi:MAG: hypothetical protein EOP02_04400 [Proteobacteria bacterium]|nr:MAG: hypothetical protein EOP02_04400 [Pseudomonadota bacterium]